MEEDKKAAFEVEFEKPEVASEVVDEVIDAEGIVEGQTSEGELATDEQTAQPPQDDIVKDDLEEEEVVKDMVEGGDPESEIQNALSQDEQQLPQEQQLDEVPKTEQGEVAQEAAVIVEDEAKIQEGVIISDNVEATTSLPPPPAVESELLHDAMVAAEVATSSLPQVDLSQSLEYISDFERRKESFSNLHKKYLDTHPEIRAFLSDYLQIMLERKPENVWQFTNEFFSNKKE